MKTTLLSFAALLTISAANAQSTWNADKAHARVGFSVIHLLLSEVDGNFNKFDAKLTAAKPDLSDAVFDLTADVSSINTGNDYRDNDLKSPKYFDATQFPTLTFKSTSFQKVDGKKYKIVGNLTMHGVTKPVTLDAMLTGPGVMENPRGKQEKAGMKITGTLKRSDFGVGSGTPVAVVSDEIELKANGEFVKQDAAMAEKLFWQVLVHLQTIQPHFGTGRRFRGLTGRFKRVIHVVDSTTIQLVASCLDWAKHRRSKAAAKCHLRLDLQSLLPRFAIVDTARDNDNLRDNTPATMASKTRSSINNFELWNHPGKIWNISMQSGTANNVPTASAAR